MRTAIPLLFLAVPAAAQNWPPEVAALVEESRSICGGDFTASPEAVTQRDLNGDGKPDWVIDSGRFQCSDSYGTYCGTRGCGIHTLIDGIHGELLLRSWDTVTEDGITYLTTHNNKGRPVRFLWSGTEWKIQ
jgi:hypothetical protein